MSIKRRIIKVGGSLAILLPKAAAEAIEIEVGTPVRLTIIGRQLVIDPEDDTVEHDTFRRAFGTVLRRYEKTFEGLAEYDRSK